MFEDDSVECSLLGAVFDIKTGQCLSGPGERDLHSASHSTALGTRKAEIVLDPTSSGFIFKKKNQPGANFDWVELGISGVYWMRLSIPYQQRFGPGGPFWTVSMVVLEDNDNCRVFFWRIRCVAGWQRDMWRFMYRNRLEKLHWAVLEQDRILLENLAPDAALMNTFINMMLGSPACAE